MLNLISGKEGHGVYRCLNLAAFITRVASFYSSSPPPLFLPFLFLFHFSSNGHFNLSVLLMEYGTGIGIGTYGIISFFFFSYSPFCYAFVLKLAHKHSLLFSFLDADSDTTLNFLIVLAMQACKPSSFILRLFSLLLTINENTSIDRFAR